MQSLAHSILAQIIKEIRLKIDYSLLLFFSSSSFIPHCLLAIQSKKPASSGKPSSCKYRFGSLIDFSLHAKSQNQTRLAKKHWCGACSEYQIELEESMAHMHQCCGQKRSNPYLETYRSILVECNLANQKSLSPWSSHSLSLLCSYTKKYSTSGFYFQEMYNAISEVWRFKGKSMWHQHQ